MGYQTQTDGYSSIAIGYYSHTNGFAKVIVCKSTDKVHGMHYLGPNAGEVIQGYAAAFKVCMSVIFPP